MRLTENNKFGKKYFSLESVITTDGIKSSFQLHFLGSVYMIPRFPLVALYLFS